MAAGCPAAAWSFRCEPTEENGAGSFRAYTVQELIDDSGFERCDLLKLDIEGAEEQLLKEGAHLWLPRVDTVVVEIHGAAAAAAVDQFCPTDTFDRVEYGEKRMLRRRP